MSETETNELLPQRIFPTLRSTDWAATQAFYAKAGFDVIFEWRDAPDFPVYAGLLGHGVAFHVSEHDGDCQPGGSVAIYVDDVDATHATLAGLGLNPPAPEDMPWGDRMFTVEDPDGNSVSFFTPNPDES